MVSGGVEVDHVRNKKVDKVKVVPGKGFFNNNKRQQGSLHGPVTR
jgi:hypothetical protein